MEMNPVESRKRLVLDPTWVMSLKIWWSFTWRSVLWGGLVTVFVTALIGTLAEALGLPNQLFDALSLFFCYFMMSVFVMKRILNLKFKDFRLVVVALTDEEKEARSKKGSHETVSG